MTSPSLIFAGLLMVSEPSAPSTPAPEPPTQAADAERALEDCLQVPAARDPAETPSDPWDRTWPRKTLYDARRALAASRYFRDKSSLTEAALQRVRAQLLLDAIAADPRAAKARLFAAYAKGPRGLVGTAANGRAPDADVIRHALLLRVFLKMEHMDYFAREGDQALQHVSDIPGPEARLLFAHLVRRKTGTLEADDFVDKVRRLALEDLQQPASGWQAWLRSRCIAFGNSPPRPPVPPRPPRPPALAFHDELAAALCKRAHQCRMRSRPDEYDCRRLASFVTWSNPTKECSYVEKVGRACLKEIREYDCPSLTGDPGEATLVLQDACDGAIVCPPPEPQPQQK